VVAAGKGGKTVTVDTASGSADQAFQDTAVTCDQWKWTRMALGWCRVDVTVRLCDVATGAAACEPLCGHDGTVWSVTATADGSRIVSGGEDATVWVWDAASGTALGNHFEDTKSWCRMWLLAKMHRRLYRAVKTLLSAFRTR
jgi:WD40 repeat protein